MTLPVRWIPQAEDEWRFEDKNRSFVMRTDFPVHRDPKMKRRAHPWDHVYLVAELVVVVKVRLDEDDDEYDSEDEEATKWKTDEMSCGWAKINLRELMDEVKSRNGRSATMKFNLLGGSLVAEEHASTVSECSKGFQRHRGWRAIPKTLKNIVQGPSRSRLCLTVTYVVSISLFLCLSLYPFILMQYAFNHSFVFIVFITCAQNTHTHAHRYGDESLSKTLRENILWLPHTILLPMTRVPHVVLHRQLLSRVIFGDSVDDDLETKSKRSETTSVERFVSPALQLLARIYSDDELFELFHRRWETARSHLSSDQRKQRRVLVTTYERVALEFWPVLCTVIKIDDGTYDRDGSRSKHDTLEIRKRQKIIGRAEALARLSRMDAEKLLHGQSPPVEDEREKLAKRKRLKRQQEEYELKLAEYERLKDKTGAVPPEPIVVDGEIHHDKFLLFSPFHINETTLVGSEHGVF